MTQPDPTTTNAYGVQTQHTTTIDGQPYLLDLYPAEEGFGHLPMLLQIASSPAGLALDAVMTAVSEVKGGELPTHLTGEQLRMCCIHLAEALVQAGGAQRARELLHYTKTRRAGQLVNVGAEFSACFQGRYGHLFKVLAWVLEVNFAPFLRGAWPGILSRLTSVRQDLSSALNQSPQSSTSQAGDGSSTASPSPTT